MYDGRTKSEAAHVELRRRLTDGLALAGLTKTALARRAALGRTTVQLAFQADAPAPSAETVAALARALRLPEQPLLDLRRTASGDDETVFASGLGKRISEWGPHQLEVHPAGPHHARVELRQPKKINPPVSRNDQQLTKDRG
jgi:hypothetical protein